MHIEQFVCGSCAVGSLEGIGEHKNPEDVLRNFCYNQLGIRTKYRKTYSTLTCFYVFCAGPEVKSNEKGGSHHSKNHWPKYGTELAQYITDNELGDIVTIGPKKNLKHHKTTTAQAWIWSPDQKALERWWDVNFKRDPKVPSDFDYSYEDEGY